MYASILLAKLLGYASLTAKSKGQSAAEHQSVVWSTLAIAQRVLQSRRAHGKWQNKLTPTLGQKRSILQRKFRA